MTNAFSQCEYTITNEYKNVVKLMKMNKSVLYLIDRIVWGWFVEDIKTINKIESIDMGLSQFLFANKLFLLLSIILKGTLVGKSNIITLKEYHPFQIG